VAHPQNCWVRHRIVATKFFFLWRTMGVRHRNPLSVAHLAWCATEIHISVAHLPGAPQNSEKIQKIQKLQKKIKKFQKKSEKSKYEII
jgi:hypothetical protein